MSHNTGETSLRRKRRARDPMAAFDGLPTPLRRWLTEAALPWSPASARRIWVKARARGLTTQDALEALHRAEQKTLAKDRLSPTG